MSTPSSFIDKEVLNLVKEEVALTTGVDVSALPQATFSTVPTSDFSINVAQYVSTLKQKNGPKAPELAQQFADKINQSTDRKLILEAKAEKVYLNLKADKKQIFQMAIESVSVLGENFGSSKPEKPLRVVIEHTSANPNSPLHVGNLRNVMIGAHLSRIMKFAGCDVKEYFFVNDLGGQIGLTALGYSRLKSLPEGVKLDHLIGSVYAIMNTFNEAQKLGLKLSELQHEIVTRPIPEKNEDETKPHEKDGKKGPKGAAEPELSPEEKAAKDAADLKAKTDEIIDIAQDLRIRYPELYDNLFACFTDDDNIAVLGAALNKAYENKEPEAVKIIRKMATDTLTGQQQTLTTYGVKHDRFDFESEISWEGTSEALINIFRQSPFFHPQTQCNSLGKPEGAFLDLDAYLTSIKAKRGKGGYSKNYPNFYVLRPDGTTLYTLRDVAYSMKKISEADMVLNVICTEQNLPQEKVMLTLKALGVEKRIQFHMAYELVKLSKHGKIQRMSGRRGIYVLADELYDQLKVATREQMDKSQKKQVDTDNEQEVENICHVVANAAMKYSLLCVSPRIPINFDIDAAVDPKGNNAAFILYSGARIASILRKYDEGIKNGKFAPEPEVIDWSLLNEPQEWEILTTYVMPFASKVVEAALPEVPPEPRLPEFGTHVIPQFACQLAVLFSSYYGRVKILSNDAAMYPRVKFCKAVLRVLHNAMRLFMVDPLDSM